MEISKMTHKQLVNYINKLLFAIKNETDLHNLEIYDSWYNSACDELEQRTIRRKAFLTRKGL